VVALIAMFVPGITPASRNIIKKWPTLRLSRMMRLERIKQVIITNFRIFKISQNFLKIYSLNPYIASIGVMRVVLEKI